MNILFVVDDFSGGAGNIVQLLALELKKQKNRVSILLTHKHTEPRYQLKEIRLYDENLSEICGNKLFRLQKMVEKIKKIVETDESELVISFLDNNNTIVCLALMKKDIPIIVSERSNPLVIIPKFPWGFLRRIAYKRADVITVQFDIFRRFDGGRFQKKCLVTHNIIEPSPVIKVEEVGKRISFVSMGRYAKIKRYDLMIKMFAKFWRNFPETTLNIFGANIDNPELQKLIDEYGIREAVSLHDAISNVHEELAKHDIYLMTSEQEGFPNALSEALSVGLPAIAFKCHEGISNLIKSEENGYCVEMGDENGFVEAMRKIVSDTKLRSAFSEKSIETAKAYSAEVVMKQWEQCVKQAMLRRNR